MSQLQILVVDDQEDNLRILSTVLEHAGYAVLAAQSVEEGLTLARRHWPDLVLLDLMMPGTDGWTAIRELRDDAGTRDIPAIAVTASDAPGLEKRLRAAGFCAYLKKPFFPREALDAVKRCLSPGAIRDGWVELPNYASLRPPTL